MSPLKSTQPRAVIPRSLRQMFAGTPLYPPARLHQTITMADGNAYRVFREVILRDNPPQEAGGVFRVWFYSVTPPRVTIWMSQLTKLFFFGMPGFRGKMWLLNDATGEFGGIYQFDTVEDARAYAESFAMKLSKRRSRPGMFTLEVYAKEGEASLFRAGTHPVLPPALQPTAQSGVQVTR